MIAVHEGKARRWAPGSAVSATRSMETESAPIETEIPSEGRQPVNIVFKLERRPVRPAETRRATTVSRPAASVPSSAVALARLSGENATTRANASGTSTSRPSIH